MKQDNSSAIIVLCSHLCTGENVVPLEPAEWAKLAQKLLINKKQPSDIFNFENQDFKSVLNIEGNEIERIKRLIDRSVSITFEIEKLKNIGINILTRADKEYPSLLKNKLNNLHPPLFYYVGNINILNDECLGIVGSRIVFEEDIAFTKKIVDSGYNNNFTIVSGGAKGIDSISTKHILEKGGAAIEFLSDSMIKKLKDSFTIKAIRDERLLLLSLVKPDAGFNVGFAMQRNKFIYAQSLGTVIVKSDLEKGGTWNGAIENLKNKWAHAFCWNNPNYNGNIELIKKGAIAIGDDFDAIDIKKPLKKPKSLIQSSIFDML